MAKVLLITDHSLLVNRFPEKPTVYNLVRKTVIYIAGSLMVRYVERLIHFCRATGHFAVETASPRRRRIATTSEEIFAIWIGKGLEKKFPTSHPEVARYFSRDPVVRIQVKRTGSL